MWQQYTKHGRMLDILMCTGKLHYADGNVPEAMVPDLDQ